MDVQQFIPVITAAGLRAAQNASQSGLSIVISEIGFGSTGWTPTASATALRNERERAPVSGGRNDLGPYTTHVTGIADGASEYWVREIGFYLEDGTLLAIWSQPDQPLGYKSAAVPFLGAFDLVLESLPADSVTINVGDTNLNIVYAPEFATLAAAIGQLGETSANQYDELRRLRGATSPWNNV